MTLDQERREERRHNRKRAAVVRARTFARLHRAEVRDALAGAQ